MNRLTRRDCLRLGAGAGLAAASSNVALGCGSDKPQPPDADPMNATVHAVLGDSLAHLYEMSKDAAGKLGIGAKAFLGETVFIKPNLVSLGITEYQADLGECSKAEIVAGVAEQCREAVAARITNYEIDDLKHLVMSRNLSIGATSGISLRGAHLDDLRIPDWEKANPLPEWGVSSEAHAYRGGPQRGGAFPLPTCRPSSCLPVWSGS